jgi:hypothetical protein
MPTNSSENKQESSGFNKGVDFTKYFDSVFKFENLLFDKFQDDQNVVIIIIDNVITFKSESYGELKFKAEPIYSIKKLPELNINELHICPLNITNTSIEKLKKNEFIFSKLSEICKFETIYDCIMENENNTEKETIDKEELEKYKKVTTDDFMCSLIINELNCDYIWHQVNKPEMESSSEPKTNIEIIIYTLYEIPSE